MPAFTVLEKSYLPDGTRANDGSPSGMCRIYEAGETVEFSGAAGPNLEPKDEAGKALRVLYENNLIELREKRARENPQSGVGDPAAFAAAFAIELAKANETQTTQITAQISAGIADAFAKLFPNGLSQKPRAA